MEKIVNISERGSLTEKKRYHYKCLTPHGHGGIQLFQKFQKIAEGGHDEKLKNFGKSKKKSVIFTNKQKILFEKKISKLR